MKMGKIKFKKLKSCCLFLFLIVALSRPASAKTTELGAQIWIEPGYSKQEIEKLVELASGSGLKTFRVWAMWSHLEPQPGVWNFDIYDWLFQACEKNNIKLQVTLTSTQAPPHYGKEFWWQVHTPAVPFEHLDEAKAAEYIKRLVERYRNSPALENWWLLNEPRTPDNVTERKRVGFRMEMEKKYKDIRELNKSWGTNFGSFNEVYPNPNGGGWAYPMPYYDWQHYCLKYYTEYQRWLRDEIFKYDTIHGFCSNPAGVLQSFPWQETTEWRTFLTSIGTTIHPSWQFQILKSRDQYPMAVGAICEVIKSNAYPHPFWISELQAGNNTFSGGIPMCPMYSDIAQWTWAGIGKGAEKIIYWLLNPRPSGCESGEWGMLNFMNEPSERLKAATDVANCMNKESSFFDKSKPVGSKVTILISPESGMTLQRKQNNSYPGLDAEAHIKSALGCYESFAEKGIEANITQTQDFQWANSKEVVAIMPHIITVKTALYDSIKVFLKGGNKLIVLGTTFYYDELENCMFQKEFPLKNEFGASLADLILYADHFQLPAMEGKYNFEVRSWFGAIQNSTAEPISRFKEYTTGIRHKTGNSEVVWIPANIGLGAWLYDNTQLSAFLYEEVKPFIAKRPFVFTEKANNIDMQTLTDSERYVTVINNGNNENNTLSLKNMTKKKARIIFCSDKSRIKVDANKRIDLSPRECLVLMWE